MDMVDAGMIVFGPIGVFLIVYGIMDFIRSYKEAMKK